MKKYLLLGVALAVGAFGFTQSAKADRTVMVMLQEVPTTMTPPAGSPPVMVEIKMTPMMMKEISADMTDGSMTLTCMPGGPLIVMCHGK